MALTERIRGYHLPGREVLPGVRIGINMKWKPENVTIRGPVVIGGSTSIGDGCLIEGSALIGAGCVIEPGAEVGNASWAITRGLVRWHGSIEASSPRASISISNRLGLGG
jgi:NDP-sugar pyrophosphorylase family protein